jgi:hypothetical protein
MKWAENFGRICLIKKIKPSGYGKGNDARIASFDSPFVLRFSKDQRRLRTGFGYVLGP